VSAVRSSSVAAASSATTSSKSVGLANHSATLWPVLCASARARTKSVSGVMLVTPSLTASEYSAAGAGDKVPPLISSAHGYALFGIGSSYSPSSLEVVE
jgi:hypothetical protein